MEQIDSIAQAAKDGDVSAMTALGKRKLAEAAKTGVRTLEEGYELLQAAAGKGSAEADYFISLIDGIFAKEQHEWSLALAHLRRSAERGWQSARQQLCLLATDRELAAAALSGQCDDDVWEKLRATIDIAALLASPAATEISQTPRIKIIEGFASTAECAWMIEQSRGRIEYARVFEPATGMNRIDNLVRTNGHAWFDILDANFVLMLLRARIALATGSARPSLEPTSVMHYAGGQKFAEHADWYDATEPHGAAQIRLHGQRVATFLLYLNDGFEGAETEFPLIGWRYKGAPGDALFFMNVDEAGKADRLTRHTGLPPTSGEKWLLSQWIRGVPGVGL